MDPVTWRSAHSLFLHKESLASVCEPCCARLPKLCLRSPLARDSSYNVHIYLLMPAAMVSDAYNTIHTTKYIVYNPKLYIPYMQL